MAKTLIIKGANFYGNAVDHVTFGGTVPCTGVSIDITEKTLTTVAEQFTITATIVPTNTTDKVVWSSNDSDIVDVSNGVVTMKGIGTANVTVSCGNYSAVCAVTVSSAIVDFKYGVGTYISNTDNNYDCVRCASTTATDGFTVGFSKDVLGSGLYAFYVSDQSSYGMYPIPVPKNATTLHVRCLTEYFAANNVFLLSSSTASTVYPTVAKNTKPMNIKTDFTWGDKTYEGASCWGNDITLPTDVDYDSLCILVKQQGSAAVTEADAQKTHIWFD